MSQTQDPAFLQLLTASAARYLDEQGIITRALCQSPGPVECSLKEIMSSVLGQTRIAYGFLKLQHTEGVLEKEKAARCLMVSLVNVANFAQWATAVEENGSPLNAVAFVAEAVRYFVANSNKHPELFPPQVEFLFDENCPLLHKAGAALIENGIPFMLSLKGLQEKPGVQGEYLLTDEGRTAGRLWASVDNEEDN